MRPRFGGAFFMRGPWPDGAGTPFLDARVADRLIAEFFAAVGAEQAIAFVFKGDHRQHRDTDRDDDIASVGGCLFVVKRHALAVDRAVLAIALARAFLRAGRPFLAQPERGKRHTRPVRARGNEQAQRHHRRNPRAPHEGRLTRISRRRIARRC